MNVRAVGEYIRKQRTNARLSLKKLSGLAGVSIPYLSQVERGLRRPSADILQAIAKALRISAETLYVQAGILEDRRVPDVATAVLADPTITERQKQALIQIYEAFREETGRKPPPEEGTGQKHLTRAIPRSPARTDPKAPVPRRKRGSSRAGPLERPSLQAGGRTQAAVARTPSPGPQRPPAANARPRNIRREV